LKQTLSNPCVFINEGDASIILAVYVDDGLIAAKDDKSADHLLSELGNEFKIIVKELELFLGFQIIVQPNGHIFINQTAYIKKLLEKFRMVDANPVAIPAEKGINTKTDSHPKDSALTIETPYQEAVGSLMYLAIGTRPDIVYAVGAVSQYLKNPTKLD
jgi:hypothetical protein